MASVEKSNERRRRIMERGSDRLALITGQLKNLERTSSLPSAAPPSLSFNDRSEIHLDGPAAAAEVTPRKQFTVPPQQVPKAESNHTRSVTASDITTKPQAPPKSGPPPTHKPPPSSTSTSTSCKTKQPTTFFSSRRLNACIIASEMPRAKCSTVIAVMVLLFHFAGPLFGIHGGCCWEKYKPVYLILVTSVTVVLVRMVQGKGMVVEDTGKQDKAAENAEDKNWRDAFMVLERGLTAYQAIRAMFIDCSIYLVVVISGLSLASI
ncbi:hypothetical protein LINGRAHAP2_LOCUS7336 [Linum grandiflorum]